MKKILTLIAVITLCFGNIQAQNWDEIIKTVASDRGSEDAFGNSVAISGDYAIVGATEEDHDVAGFNTKPYSGSAYVFERNGAGVWVEVQKLVASDRDSSDFFGVSVAISGNYIIVGANGNSYDAAGLNPFFSAGAAYVFERNVGGTWNEVQKLVASDRAANDQFGFSVAISGNYIIVGANRNIYDAAGLNPFFSAGAAYVFERNVGGVWNEVQKLVASDRAGDDRFGWSVAISGDYAIIGAFDEYTAGLNPFFSAGSAYVFERNVGGVWTETQKLIASDRGSGDRFGWSVAISGDYAVVGAHNNDENAVGLNTLIDAGAAYVFERNVGGVWNEVEKLVASDRGAGDAYGWSVAISGNYAIVGAPFEGHDVAGLNTAPGAGSAYLYKRSVGGTWNETQKLVASDRSIDNYFGFSVTISDNYAIVGARHEDDDAAGLNFLAYAGAAYIFSLCLPVTSSFSTTTCASYTVPSGDETYTALGTYPVMDTIPNSCGNDSVMSIILTILPIKTGSITTTICNEGSVVVNGTTYNAANPSGTEVITNVGPNNCDSTITINLTVLLALTGTVTTTICNEENIVVNGTTYNAGNPSGTEIFPNIGPNNCDSTVTINLNVLPALTGSVTTTLCNESTTDIIVNGTTYNTTNPSGTEIFTNIGPNNCDSTVTINLNVLPAKIGSVTNTICNDDSVIVNGTTYNLTNPTGTELFTNIGPNNCDSTVTVALNVLPVLTGSVTNTICNEDSIIVNGTTYNAANPTGTEVFANCDSTVTINLTVLPAKTGSVTTTICNETSIVINGTTYNAVNPTGTEVITNVGPNNCDSTVTINLTVLPALTGSVITTICNEENIVVNGTTYNAGNPTGTEVIANVGPNNCDSTVTINLNVLPALTGSVTTTLCNESTTDIIVNGSTYNTTNPSGTEIFTNIGANNCDSTVTINLNVLPAKIGSVTNTICNDDSVIVNGTTYNLGNPSGTEVFTNIGSNNCDSTVTISLNVLPVLTGSVTSTICNEDSIIVNGTIYNAANPTGTEVFANCDSTVTINLTVLPTKTGTVTNTICNEASIIINGTTYNAGNPTGTEVITNVGPNNCDSTVTIALNVLPALTGSVTTTICNEGSIVINGTTYNAANPTGTEIFTNIGANNCDSTVTVNLNVLPALIGSVTTTICNDDSVIVNGTTYNAANPTGTEIFTNIGANNCDSTVTINLNVLPALIGSVTNTICNDDSVIVNGTTYNAANLTGTEVFTNVGVNNCDSMVTINLTVLSIIDTSTTTTGFVITANQTGATYQWIDCTNGNVIIAGETNANYTATNNGDYAVVVTVGSCSDTSACVNISTVGITNIDGLLSGVEIYPNPTKGLFTVRLAKVETGAKIEVYSVVGQQIINKTIISNQTLIDLSNFEKGIYLIKIKNGSKIITERIIKQ